MDINLSEHTHLRMAQRNLSMDDLEYVMEYAHKLHKAGALIYYLRKKDIPAWDQPNARLARLAGTAVVVTRDGRLVMTTWRNLQTGLQHLKKKPDHSTRNEEYSH